jgi:hypothetical protein
MVPPQAPTKASSEHQVRRAAGLGVAQPGRRAAAQGGGYRGGGAVEKVAELMKLAIIITKDISSFFKDLHQWYHFVNIVLKPEAMEEGCQKRKAATSAAHKRCHEGTRGTAVCTQRNPR